mmetsp:Transcript_11571/g.21895  ORF Transcript_11571/g.21895 Transcript_11571/m.21895 type:complete len:84 (-) Transcript_11571:378-629(-)
MLHVLYSYVNNLLCNTSPFRDMEVALNKLVPGEWTKDGTFLHTMEGEDDMPGHVKSSLMGPSLNIPVSTHCICRLSCYEYGIN